MGLGVSPAGAATLAGFFNGTSNTGGSDLVSAGGYDILVARLDASGNHLWSKRFGDASDQYAQAVSSTPAGEVVLAGNLFGAVDFGGGVLPSNGSRDALLVKLTRTAITYGANASGT